MRQRHCPNCAQELGYGWWFCPQCGALLRSRLKFKLRKWTTPVHIIFGLGLVLVAIANVPTAIILLVIFALWEVWDDYNHSTREGEDDWWECFAVFIGGFILAVILHFAGVITVNFGALG